MRTEDEKLRRTVAGLLALVTGLSLAVCASAKPVTTAGPPAALPPSAPPHAFEGEITMTTTVGNRGTSVFTLSGSKQRMDFPPPHGGSIIRDTTTGEITIVSAESRLATIEDAIEGTGGPPVVEAHKTGVDTVAGRACDLWRITEADDVVDACVATSIPPIRIGKHAAWEARAPGFPLRVRVVDSGGVERLSSVVVQIVERPIPAATFEVPAGYKTVHAAQ
jgi:hypothetical protein